MANEFAQKWGHSVEPIQIGPYIDKLRAKRSTPNGVFVAKVLFEDFEALWCMKLFRDFFVGAEKILLRRSNIVEQAISYLFAKYTGQWIREDAPRMLKSEVPRDIKELTFHIDRIERQNDEWDKIFAVHSFPVQRVIYEDVLNREQELLSALVERLGVGQLPSSFKAMARTAVQRDQENLSFFEMFRANYDYGPASPLAETVVYEGFSFAN